MPYSSLSGNSRLFREETAANVLFAQHTRSAGLLTSTRVSSRLQRRSSTSLASGESKFLFLPIACAIGFAIDEQSGKRAYCKTLKASAQESPLGSALKMLSICSCGWLSQLALQTDLLARLGGLGGLSCESIASHASYWNCRRSPFNLKSMAQAYKSEPLHGDRFAL